MKRVTLDDKYDLEARHVLLSGIQALVRLPLMQRARDREAGLKTAGFISGYRGSPIGTYDSELTRAAAQLSAYEITFQPGVNEDLAATSIMGTQQVHTLPGPKVDGVFSLWYGKGPGVDRSGDALKHGNLAGTASLGGVLVVAADDHSGKSSTVAHASEAALAAAGIPVLYPAGVEEILRFGLLGWAGSRYSGLWVALKCVNETLESTATVAVAPEIMSQWRVPMTRARREGVHFDHKALSALAPLEDERRLVRQKLPLWQAFVAANGIDRVAIAPAERKLGIVAAGKSYGDTLHALSLLGLDRAAAEERGVGLYKPGCIWPLEPDGLRAFARGYRELLFVEEKRAFLEEQAARVLYDIPADLRPDITGKTDPAGAALLPADGVIDTSGLAIAIARRLEALGMADAAIQERVHAVQRQGQRQAQLRVASVSRAPYFCSGCPHNTSTRVPQGAVALGGIGCHGMGIFMGRSLRGTHMGAEGLNWVGLSPFTRTKHVFQNIGDGTYSHSGLLAIHAAVAANVNITYKLLYNDAVAMTGGQPVEGALGVSELCAQLRAMGVKDVRVVADDPRRVLSANPTLRDVPVTHRDTLETVQRELAQVVGVTALIYDQTCATEKRRRRKRGTMPAAAERAFINERVCEGCGDCSVQSNCVSLVPVETALGRKRAIDQAGCNQDLSCVQGFCPSFVTVEGARLRKLPVPDHVQRQLKDLPEPRMLESAGINVLVAGVGGTGVVTLGAVLAMAAHIDRWHVATYDMTGMAQKGGAVLSHLRLQRAETPTTPAIGLGEADVILGCDIIVTGSPEVLKCTRAGDTRVVLNTHVVPTGAFQRNPDMDLGADDAGRGIAAAVGETQVDSLDAADIARRWAGDAQLANMLLAGFAWQRGLLPLSLAAIEHAIAINGAAVAANRHAFAVGRLVAERPDVLRDTDRDAEEPGEEDFVAARMRDLVDYQDEAYAARYVALVQAAADREAALGLPAAGLRDAVARAFFKLMAYKDEYEVARLYSDGEFMRRLHDTFEGPVQLRFHLAPPLLAPNDPTTGRPRKLRFGSWMRLGFLMLAKMRPLRGTPFDPFGHTKERRRERESITDYEALMQRILAGLDASNHALACRIASVPLQVRGFGPVKLGTERVAEALLKQLLQQWEHGPTSTSLPATATDAQAARVAVP